MILFHEKPFAGINGSGKHSNWSVGLDNGVNFFKSSADPSQQELFMASIAALMYAIHTHSDLIRIACSGAGNDHRLGAQEAPPAIMSLYPGIILENKIDEIINGGALAGYAGEGRALPTGCAALMPTMQTAAEDRNRTAPFPYCGGNRFEFRAVGSSQNCAWGMTMVNTAFADGMSARPWFGCTVDAAAPTTVAQRQRERDAQRICQHTHATAPPHTHTHTTITENLGPHRGRHERA